jgi:predicted amidohydrolase/ribosomal protein S18 acetylase RimI-like enzyme
MDFDTPAEHKLHLRNLRIEDYDHIRAIMERVYRNVDSPWTREQIEAMIKRFPEGQICIEDKGQTVAVALALIIDFSEYGDRHTYLEVIGEGTLENHDPEGDSLYGIEVFVHPDYQGMRLGRRLYDARKELCEKLNLRAIIVGGRIPGYRTYKDELTPQEYIKRVTRKEIYDPVLSFQLSNDFYIRKLLRGYYPEDHQSAGNAVLLGWTNIYYEAKTRLIGGRKTVVRLGAVQWQMRRFASFDDFLQQVEFFVDTVSDYEADLVLFPELFNAPLIAQFEKDSPPEAMRKLAGYTENLREELMRLALAYNINIVTGSIPEYRDHKLYNVSFLCRRDGTWDAQYKLHITPDERGSWGLLGGDRLRVFQTDIGKIGILICYDIEFPELARILATQGVNIILVPFWTDTKNAYLRVRRCAQARAIENECYVVISGSVGNIPKVETMGIQYSQSAIFTPSDFAFPHDAIAAETTPNTETTLIADLDLDLLKELRRHGSVRNLESRRRDLYSLEWLNKQR